MNRVLVLFVLAACGGKAAPAQPLENKEPGQVKDIVQPMAAGARIVARTSSGGVLELEGDRGKAMGLADQEMQNHCGPNAYTIVQEGEEAIAMDGGTGTAWRVHYQCN